MKTINCASCKGVATQATTTHTTTKGIVIKNVPCYTCEQCKEEMYFDNVVSVIETIIKTVESIGASETTIDYIIFTKNHNKKSA
jgi:YgiT-type zinc finger domain-containing protein